MKIPMVGQPVTIGLKASKCFQDVSRGDEMRVEAVGHDWVVLRKIAHGWGDTAFLKYDRDMDDIMEDLEE